jgi:hypothetical protein
MVTAIIPSRAKWRSSPSAWSSVRKKYLTAPTLLEMAGKRSLGFRNGCRHGMRKGGNARTDTPHETRTNDKLLRYEAHRERQPDRAGTKPCRLLFTLVWEEGVALFAKRANKQLCFQWHRFGEPSSWQRIHYFTQIFIWSAISLARRISECFFQIPGEDGGKLFEVRRDYSQMIPWHSLDLELLG